MYGSPFPPLNPKVRYKTALERAGFDVNRDELAAAAARRRSPERTLRSVTSPVAALDTAGPPRVVEHAHRGDTNQYAQLNKKPSPASFYPSGQPWAGDVRVGSAPVAGTHDRGQENSTYGAERYSEGAETSGNPYAGVAQPTVNPYAQASNQTNANPYGGSANYQTAQYGDTQPVEDTPNLFTMNEPAFQPNNGVAHDAMDPIEKSFMMLTQSDSKSILGSEPPQNLHRSPANTASPHTSAGKTHAKSIDNLNLEPNAQLSIAVESPLNLGLERTSRQVDPLASRPDSTSQKLLQTFNVEETTPNLGHDSSTNLQVEQLIAQLDDVSLSRNERLDTGMGPPNSLQQHQRAKKSSAYMSGFPAKQIQKPVVNTDSIYQPSQLASRDSSESSASEQSFTYAPNIRTGPGQGYGGVRGQLGRHSNESDFYASSSTSLLLGEPRQDVTTTTPEPPRKIYPPGEGPCRGCNLEIHGRGVCSKRQNELSGQWHRECFHCSSCDVRFNRRTTCYIFNDAPYCQRHYHEANGSICNVCDDIIEGECLENDKRQRYHVKCLKCFLCHQLITKDYYIFNGTVPLCGNHDMDALLRDGLSPLEDSTHEPKTNHNNVISKRRTRLINYD